MDHRYQYVQQDGKVLETAIVDAPDYDHSHLRRWVSSFAKMSTRFLTVFAIESWLMQERVFLSTHYSWRPVEASCIVPTQLRVNQRQPGTSLIVSCTYVLPYICLYSCLHSIRCSFSLYLSALTTADGYTLV